MSWNYHQKQAEKALQQNQLSRQTLKRSTELPSNKLTGRLRQVQQGQKQQLTNREHQVEQLYQNNYDEYDHDMESTQEHINYDNDQQLHYANPPPPPRGPTRQELTEELERTEQSITKALQEIDRNFAKAHIVVSSKITPLLDKYSKESRNIWQSSAFWKQFFEASANVSVSTFEEDAAGEIIGEDEPQTYATTTTEPLRDFDDEDHQLQIEYQPNLDYGESGVQADHPVINESQKFSENTGSTLSQRKTEPLAKRSDNNQPVEDESERFPSPPSVTSRLNISPSRLQHAYGSQLRPTKQSKSADGFQTPTHKHNVLPLDINSVESSPFNSRIEEFPNQGSYTGQRKEAQSLAEAIGTQSVLRKGPDGRAKLFNDDSPVPDFNYSNPYTKMVLPEPEAFNNGAPRSILRHNVLDQRWGLTATPRAQNQSNALSFNKTPSLHMNKAPSFQGYGDKAFSTQKDEQVNKTDDPYNDSSSDELVPPALSEYTLNQLRKTSNRPRSVRRGLEGLATPIRHNGSNSALARKDSDEVLNSRNHLNSSGLESNGSPTSHKKNTQSSLKKPPQNNINHMFERSPMFGAGVTTSTPATDKDIKGKGIALLKARASKLESRIPTVSKPTTKKQTPKKQTPVTKPSKDYLLDSPELPSPPEITTVLKPLVLPSSDLSGGTVATTSNTGSSAHSTSTKSTTPPVPAPKTPVRHRRHYFDEDGDVPASIAKPAFDDVPASVAVNHASHSDYVKNPLPANIVRTPAKKFADNVINAALESARRRSGNSEFEAFNNFNDSSDNSFQEGNLERFQRSGGLTSDDDDDDDDNTGVLDNVSDDSDITN